MYWPIIKNKKTYQLIVTLGTISALALNCVNCATAEERHDKGRYVREHEHMRLDNHFNHGRYYPNYGYLFDALPIGYREIVYGRRRMFFHNGIWYERSGRGYLVILPPIGALVPVLPPDYTSLMYGGAPYYYANNTYYSAGPSGFMVIEQPKSLNPDTYIQSPNSAGTTGLPPMAPPAPSAPTAPVAPTVSEAPFSMVPPAGSAPNAGSPLWYYCEPTKTYYPYVSTCTQPWKPVAAKLAPR